MADALRWVLPSEEVDLLYVDEQPSDIQVPLAWSSTVTQTEPGVKGDTASGGGDKPAKLESGATVRVPLFVNTGDRIKVDTRSGAYVVLDAAPCAAPTSAGPPSSPSTSARSPAGRSTSSSAASATPFTRELVEGSRARSPSSTADRALLAGLVARPHRPARAQHPAGGPVRAAAPRRHPRRGGDRRGRRGRQGAVRRRGARLRQRDPRAPYSGRGRRGERANTQRSTTSSPSSSRPPRACARASSTRARPPRWSSAAPTWRGRVGAELEREARAPRPASDPGQEQLL